MIKTERLTLVPLNIGYSKDLFRLWGDYEVIKYTNSTLLQSVKECEDKLLYWNKLYPDDAEPDRFAILLNNNLIGIAGFPIINKDNFKCGFFYQIIREYWGRGYAYEAAQGLMDYIIKKYPKAAIIADAVACNYASLSILNKLDFSYISIEEKGFTKNGMELDVIHFERILNHV
jgi:ribosomal-protein-alanine N-acetyltransferase